MGNPSKRLANMNWIEAMQMTRDEGFQDGYDAAMKDAAEAIEKTKRLALLKAAWRDIEENRPYGSEWNKRYSKPAK